MTQVLGALIVILGVVLAVLGTISTSRLRVGSGERTAYRAAADFQTQFQTSH